MITVFEKYIKVKDRPNLNSVSPEFWEMVKLADWNSVIEYYKIHTSFSMDDEIIEDDIKLRLYKKYDFEKIKQFNNEFQKLYQNLFSYFSDYFENLDPENFDIYSDDFAGSIKSTIGRGKDAIKKCIDKPKLLIKIGDDNDYSEGFEHLLDVTEEEYWEVKCRDPFFRDTRKFNL